VCGAFDGLHEHFGSGVSVHVTGNPVRSTLERIDGTCLRRARRDDAARKQLLVLGGSGGAGALNESVPRAICKLGPAMADWQIVHQTGPGMVAETQLRYDACNREALVVSFIDNLAEVLVETDLVVCRAGGTTLAELALAGAPAVVVPFPEAADDHQRENARVFAAAGACRMLDQQQGGDGLEDRLARLLGPLARDARQRQKLGEQIHALARPDAARRVADLLCDLLAPVALRIAA
jgi:UDP-N-acetylglucosamine--N-acetylmuramyl-(pentapeptide) pyrophosphoryl-undecaprenol N-acetylglucosamine transferase